MDKKLAEIEDELDFDLDDISECRYAVCVTGLNPDGTDSGYFKLIQVFDDSDLAVTRAWGVDNKDITDPPLNINTFLVTVEEAIQSESNSDEFDFVGTVFKQELIL